MSSDVYGYFENRNPNDQFKNNPSRMFSHKTNKGIPVMGSPFLLKQL